MNRQETVIRYSECNERKRSKAMTAASKMDGVTSISIVRERKQLVVIGEGVDWVELTRSLRQVFKWAEIVSVRSVTLPTPEVPTTTSQYCNHYHHQPYTAIPVYESDPPSLCSIM